MQTSRQQELIAEISRIHDEWVASLGDNAVEFHPEDSEPHKEGEDDYSLNYVDHSAGTEQERVFQEQIAPLLAELKALSETEFVELPGSPVEGEESPTVDFDLAVNGDLVLMLVKHDFEEGSVSYRQGGEWIMVQPGEEIEALDDSDLVSVTGDATPIWDKAEGTELSLQDFGKVLLDLRD